MKTLLFLFLASCAMAADVSAQPVDASIPCHYVNTGAALVTCEESCHESLMKSSDFMYVACIDKCQCVTGDGE